MLNGIKKFEIRKNDRNFQAGDRVIFIEYNEKTRLKLNGKLKAVITYIIPGAQFGIDKKYCVFGFELIGNG